MLFLYVSPVLADDPVRHITIRKKRLPHLDIVTIPSEFCLVLGDFPLIKISQIA